MRVDIEYNEETGLIDIHTSGGTASMSETECAIVYLGLRKLLGWRGRLKLLMHRRLFKTV